MIYRFYSNCFLSVGIIICLWLETDKDILWVSSLWCCFIVLCCGIPWNSILLASLTYAGLLSEYNSAMFCVAYVELIGISIIQYLKMMICRATEVFKIMYLYLSCVYLYRPDPKVNACCFLVQMYALWYAIVIHLMILSTMWLFFLCSYCSEWFIVSCVMLKL